jgi:SAM-dependent methyltransferase
VTEQPRPFYSADGLSTDIYDARAATIAAGSSMDGDVDFYRRLAKESGGPVLDVGCGTGRVAIPLAQDGFDVVGVDLSAPMLRVAERHRSALPPEVASRLSFIEADMATLDLGREFPLVITPSRVFQFLLTTDAQRHGLTSLRAHLHPAGRLVLDLFDPRLDLVTPTPDTAGRFHPHREEFVDPESGNRIAWEVTARDPDPAHQLIREDWTTWELGPTGAVLRTETERLTLRWSLRSEMRLLFELSDLDVVAEYGDFNGGPPAYGREQVWVLEPRRVRTRAHAERNNRRNWPMSRIGSRPLSILLAVISAILIIVGRVNRDASWGTPVLIVGFALLVVAGLLVYVRRG